MKNVEKFWSGQLDGKEEELWNVLVPCWGNSDCYERGSKKIEYFHLLIIVWFYFVSKEPTIDPCGSPIFLFF